MTTDEVKDLNEALKKIDTRTSRERLNELGGDAGKLGITAKDKILEFVDAADKINVALGDDLGADAVKNIGKLAMMFGEDERIGLRGAMLATGSVINELSQNSSAAAGYLASFTARLSGVGKQAKLSQADIMGFGAVLDENMQTSELASTAFSQLITKMFQNPAKFAQLAGIEVAKFSELLKTDAEDAQPAGERTFAPQVGDEENDEYISGGDPEAKDNEAFLAKHFAYSNAEDGAYPAYQGDNQKNDVRHGTSQATSS